MWNLADDVYPFRNLETTELGPTVVLQFAFRRLASDPQHHRCVNTLSIDRMRLCERYRFEHCRIGQEHHINVTRRDLLATPVDELLDPSFQIEIAARVQAAKISTTEPSINKTRGVCLRVVNVSGDNGRTTH